jgi:hypothetical protein
MKYSRVQRDIWRAREELQQELAGMNTEQLRQWSARVLKEFTEQTGIHLPTVSRQTQVPRAARDH